MIRTKDNLRLENTKSNLAFVSKMKTIIKEDSDLKKIIDIDSYPIKTTLKILLQDKTTKKNIVWATDTYYNLGPNYISSNQIFKDLISGANADIVQPRVYKVKAEQAKRTKAKAEVFTPIWICNQMNNCCDNEWFERENVFNVQNDKKWIPTDLPIVFPEGKTWKQYVDSRRIEITCGEAPFLVSRYDTTTGEELDIKNRIGMLDRKLRVVNENTYTEEDWMKWTIRAFQSTYGYEYQGDNLLIARINLLMTFVDYMQHKWHREPTEKELKKLANIISWNIWQMDGLTGLTPTAVPNDTDEQISFEDYIESSSTPVPCIIHDWRSWRTFEFNSIKTKT